VLWRPSSRRAPSRRGQRNPRRLRERPPLATGHRTEQERLPKAPDPRGRERPRLLRPLRECRRPQGSCGRARAIAALAGAPRRARRPPRLLSANAAIDASGPLAPRMRYLAVIREPGPPWDFRKSMREQADWGAHAEFMDALAEEGFVVLGGAAPRWQQIPPRLRRSERSRDPRPSRAGSLDENGSPQDHGRRTLGDPPALVAL
jgi:hypothetical protein